MTDKKSTPTPEQIDNKVKADKVNKRVAVAELMKKVKKDNKK
jgi:hypothetical protein